MVLKVAVKLIITAFGVNEKLFCCMAVWNGDSGVFVMIIGYGDIYSPWKR